MKREIDSGMPMDSDNVLTLPASLELIGNTKYNARLVSEEEDAPISENEFDPSFLAWCINMYDRDSYDCELFNKVTLNAVTGSKTS